MTVAQPGDGRPIASRCAAMAVVLQGFIRSPHSLLTTVTRLRYSTSALGAPSDVLRRSAMPSLFILVTRFHHFFHASLADYRASPTGSLFC